MSAATNTTWGDGLRRVRAEGQGMLRLWFIGPADAVRLVAASLCGDRWAAGLLRATARCAANVVHAPPRKPALCLCCSRPLHNLGGVVFCVAIPEVERPAEALGSVICSSCATTSDLQSRAIQALRSVWPDLRQIEVMPGPGTVQ